MVSQNGRGELTIGDSHEYDGEVDPFDKAEIEARILDYLRGFLDVPGLQIASRWHGTYAKHPRDPYLVLRPVPGVMAVTGVGGAGMTLSFGLAAEVVEEALGPEMKPPFPRRGARPMVAIRNGRLRHGRHDR